MIGRYNGSHVKFIEALSPALMNTSGSTGPSNFSGYEWATMIVSLGCGASVAPRFVVNVERSGTSDGTFGQIGASVSLSSGSAVHVRSWALNSSAIWHRLSYSNAENGSFNANITVVLSSARISPISPQDDKTTVYQDVI